MSRPLVILLQCLVAVAVVANLCALAYYVRSQIKEADRKAQAEATTPMTKLETENKATVIRMNRKSAEAYGVATEASRAGVWREGTVVFGRVVPNPRATYEIRTPFPGTLQTADSPWPTPGQTVRSGQTLAHVTVRVAPADRLDLQVRLAEARLKKSGADEIVKLRQGLVNRLTKAGTGAVSPRELEDAQAQLAEAETQWKTATQSVDLWAKALEEIDAARSRTDGPWTRPMTAPEIGSGAVLEVAEIAAQPGTAVEAGGLVVRLVDVSRPLVRLDLPVEALRDGPPPSEVVLRLADPVPSSMRGAPNRPEAVTPDSEMRAVLVGPVSQADLASQFIGYYYAVRKNDNAPALSRIWRPGLFVQANVSPPSTEAADEPNAVVVPASAVLYHQGRALVYIASAADKYERREVQILGFRDDHCYLVPRSSFLIPPPSNIGLSGNELVVSSGAQVLLSTEFRRDGDDD